MTKSSGNCWFLCSTSLSRETLIKENFLVSQVLFAIRFYAVLTERIEASCAKENIDVFVSLVTLQ